jgi:hypothetical protein
MTFQKPLTTTTKSDKVDTMENKLELVEVLDGLFESIFNKILSGTASQDEYDFASDNDEMAGNCILWLQGEQEFTSQDREDVMELWVSAKELQLL